MSCKDIKFYTPLLIYECVRTGYPLLQALSKDNLLESPMAKNEGSIGIDTVTLVSIFVESILYGIASYQPFSRPWKLMCSIQVYLSYSSLDPLSFSSGSPSRLAMH